MTTPRWYRRTLTGGESGTDVNAVNRKLGVVAWVFGEDTQAYVRGLQHQHGLPVTGQVDEDTATLLGEAADGDLPPEWFTRDLGPGDEGEDVSALRERLEVPSGTLFDDDVRRAILRFQSAKSLPLTGKVDGETALLLQ